VSQFCSNYRLILLQYPPSLVYRMLFYSSFSQVAGLKVTRASEQPVNCTFDEHVLVSTSYFLLHIFQACSMTLCH
jgi:hypothetical protein